MTLCEKLGYKVGDRFVVKDYYETSSYKSGDVVVLVADDATASPEFKNETTSERGVYITLSRLDKIADTWDGKGLPPVGTVCEHGMSNMKQTGKVVCHVRGASGLLFAIFQLEKGGWLSSNQSFSPIKSKKTEAELMEEIFNKSGIQGLIDAGYRK